jgi:hypothetical protein
LNEVVGEATDVDNMNFVPPLATGAGVVVDRITAIADTINPVMTAWDPLLEKIKLFSQIVDGISEVRFKCRWSPRSSHVRF